MGVKVDIAAEFTGAAAFKKAGKATKGLDLSVKHLAKSMGLALGAGSLVALAKNAAKAFAEDQVGATRLANAVKNLGMEMEAPAIEKYIESLSTTAAIADDKLRPAFQALLTQTGSLVLSQDMLAQAIEISRGSGVELETVVSDLSQAYIGNTKGLKKYNLGLTKTELATASFAEIQAKLKKQFSGSSSAYLETYAGKMEAITVAGGEIQETLGKGVIDALMALTDNTSIQGLVADLKDAAAATADFLKKVGEIGGRIVRGIDRVNSWFSTAKSKIEEATTAWDNFTNHLKADVVVDPQDTMTNYLDRVGESKQADIKLTDKYVKAQKEAAAAAAAAAAKAAKLKREQLAAEKKATILKNASSMFDMKQIQIVAALKGNISEQDRTRLQLQLALATDNSEEAQKLTYKLAIAQGMTVALAKELATMPSASNPFAAWKGYLDDVELQAKRIAAFKPPVVTPPVTPALAASNLPTTVYTSGTYVPTSGYVPPTNVAPVPSTSYSGGTGTGQGGSIFDSYKLPPIVVQIDGNAVATALQTQSMSGTNTTVDRTNGSFNW
jgi:hypothetical protein